MKDQAMPMARDVLSVGKAGNHTTVTINATTEQKIRFQRIALVKIAGRYP
jgi:hypothetical protein